MTSNLRVIPEQTPNSRPINDQQHRELHHSGKVSCRLELFQSGGSVLKIDFIEKEVDDPHTYEEAMQSVDFKLWEIAMKAKMDSMYAIGGYTWYYTCDPNDIVHVVACT
ncbi:hypothetical protein J1N35_037764 [Gossypium stocksii]|uniref:Uncharacterized protein n=1 Tax=Gossypium stocksii TaxID=47602 RepID=A0A9D3UL53_9ROSI|nr:hypothetical protein J1N35_037764 [Gossypium stocksii]